MTDNSLDIHFSSTEKGTPQDGQSRTTYSPKRAILQPTNTITCLMTEVSQSFIEYSLLPERNIIDALKTKSSICPQFLKGGLYLDFSNYATSNVHVKVFHGKLYSSLSSGIWCYDRESHLGLYRPISALTPPHPPPPTYASNPLKAITAAALQSSYPTIIAIHRPISCTRASVALFSLQK